VALTSCQNVKVSKRPTMNVFFVRRIRSPRIGLLLAPRSNDKLNRYGLLQRGAAGAPPDNC